MRSRSSERRSLNLLRAVPPWTAREVSVLDPGCFAIVMATGITSNAIFAPSASVNCQTCYFARTFLSIRGSFSPPSYE